MAIKNPNIIPSPYRVTTEYETDFVGDFNKNLSASIAEVLKYLAKATNIAIKNADNGDNSDLLEKAELNPSPAQIEAGNYEKDHIRFKGLDISIENPKGSTRSGTDGSGKSWSIVMKNAYGYIRGTKGKDGDHIDVFIGNDEDSDKVFVVDQFIDGVFDEHKVMLGFNSEDSAKKAYLANYEKNWKGLKSITETTIENFKKWLSVKTKKRKPYKDYVEKAEDTDLEKAHNVGDLHPNGKYVWTEYLPGKFDWRNKTTSNSLSAYTIAENCSDANDCKAGIKEIKDAMKKKMDKKEPIPYFYSVRLGKLQNKLEKFSDKEIIKESKRVQFKNDFGSFTSVFIHVDPRNNSEFNVQTTVRRKNENGTISIQEKQKKLPMERYYEFVKDLELREKQSDNFFITESDVKLDLKNKIEVFRQSKSGHGSAENGEDIPVKLKDGKIVGYILKRQWGLGANDWSWDYSFEKDKELSIGNYETRKEALENLIKEYNNDIQQQSNK